MLDGLSTLQLAYCTAVLFAAYFVRGIAGFGSALVAVPLLALLIPLPLIVPVIVLLDNLASLVHGARNFKHIRWGDLLPLIPFTAAGITLALYFLKTIAPGTLTTFLGWFVLAYAIYSLTPLPPLRGSRFWAAPFGFLAGMVGTLFATGGPFTVIYLTLRQLDKAAFRGTIATIFIMDGGLRLAGFASAGFFNVENLTAALLALPLVAAGLYAGGHVHVNLSHAAFVRIVSMILMGSGTALLLK